MNKGAKLDDSHHVLRHVPSKKLIKDEDDNIIGFFPEAFAPRPSDTNGVSVNWIEYFNETHEDNLLKSIQLFRNMRKISRNSAFGVGNVEKIKKTVEDHNRKIRIVFDGHENNPSHSLIRDLTTDDLLLLETLATNAFDLILNNNISD
jgi:hypothetical protein